MVLGRVEMDGSWNWPATLLHLSSAEDDSAMDGGGCEQCRPARDAAQVRRMDLRLLEKEEGGVLETVSTCGDGQTG